MNITYINKLRILIILFFDDLKRNSRVKFLKLDIIPKIYILRIT